MKYINECNICKNTGGGYIKTILKLPFRDVVGMAEDYTQHVGYCHSCGFVFTQNPFSDEQLSNRYKNFSKYEFDDEQNVFGETEEYLFRCKRQYQFLENSIGMDAFDSMLEVGAASGYNLSLYGEKKRIGIEPSAINCKNAKVNYGVEMFCGMFNEFMKSKSNEKFDLIFMSNVLEHIVNPLDCIEECKNINNKYIFIEVPTLDFLFLDEAHGIFTDEHVNYFTLESLQCLMNNCGYELISADIPLDVENIAPAGRVILSIWEKVPCPKKHIITNRSLDSVTRYIEKCNDDMNRIKKIIEAIPNDAKLAVWGAGNCLSKLLAITKLEEKNIVRVYDSDVHKQGCLVCGLPIKRFNEEDVNGGAIDSVVVSSYRAQKAISKILKPYLEKIEVITLYDL